MGDKTELVILSDQDVAGLLTLDKVIPLVEEALIDLAQGSGHLFPVIRETIAKHDGIFGIKAGYLERREALGFKAGGFWKNNARRGLTNHQSTMVLFDPATGRPTAIVAANYITQIRTAAIGAIACRHLARTDSRILALIGTGQQGQNQLKAALHVLPEISEVFLHDAIPSAAEKLAEQLAGRPFTVHVAKSPATACQNADVIITATPSFQAVVMNEWIKPGTHITAVGTDTRGKQELDPVIFSQAKIVVDNTAQCLFLGECQHAYDAGIIAKDSIHAELGEILSGQKPGRERDDEITVFDTTGVAAQDLITAVHAVSLALNRGIGKHIEF